MSDLHRDEVKCPTCNAPTGWVAQVDASQDQWYWCGMCGSLLHQEGCPTGNLTTDTPLLVGRCRAFDNMITTFTRDDEGWTEAWEETNIPLIVRKPKEKETGPPGLDQPKRLVEYIESRWPGMLKKLAES